VLKKLLVNEIKGAKERQPNIGSYRGSGFSREERGKNRSHKKQILKFVVFTPARSAKA
jgi:hypothetical protein